MIAKRYYYCILPSGNAPEFPRIESNLARAGIPFEVCDSVSGGRAYRIRDEWVRMLPVWGGKPYLPVEWDHGHSVYTIPDEFDFEDGLELQGGDRKARWGEWKGVVT